MRARSALVALLVASVVVTAAACGAPTGRELRSDAPMATTGQPPGADTVRALNAFSLELGGALPVGDGNVAIATFAVARGMAMARLGARTTTRAALDHVLGADQISDFDLGVGAVDASVREQSGVRRSATRKGTTTLALPASLWLQEETAVAPDLLDRLARTKGTGVRVVDFRSEPDEARNAINRWATAETDGVVDLLVPRGEITDYTRFVVASAGAVRAPWAVRFDPAETAPRPFTRIEGDTVDVMSMAVADTGSIRSATTDRWDAVEIPYLGGELAMVLVVPKVGTFGAVASTFDTEALQQVTEALAPRPIQLRMPRFQFTSVLNLDEELGSMGLSDAFSTERADFEGITGDEVLSISDVVHGTYAAADEEGSDGEAVTVVPPLEVPGTPATTIEVDRPFLFLVRDRVTGLVLQVGRVLEPRD